MTDEDEDVKKPSGRWLPGQSGNKNGRPAGVKNKKMTQKQLSEYLGKRTEHYLKKIEDIAEGTGDLKLRFRAYNELLNLDFQIRAIEYKEWIDKENLKLKKQASKLQKDNDDDHQKEEPAPAQVLSLKLGGKQ